MARRTLQKATLEAAVSVLRKPYFHDEGAAVALLESLLWPSGPACPRRGALYLVMFKIEEGGDLTPVQGGHAQSSTGEMEAVALAYAASRCFSMRRKISPAAAGMLVPGPKMAATPPCFRKS